MNKEYYITNCILRILSALCSGKRETWRARDIAHGITIAATNGIDEAHEYFQNLSVEAEKGRYA